MHVYMRRGVLEETFSHILMPVDTPLGAYALCIEDAVPVGLTQTRSAHIAQKLRRVERMREREETIAACEKALEEAIAAAPPAAEPTEDGRAVEGDATVVQARASLEQASKPLALSPVALGQLGGMVRQALSLEPFYVAFKVVDPREQAEE